MFRQKWVSQPILTLNGQRRGNIRKLHQSSSFRTKKRQPEDNPYPGLPVQAAFPASIDSMIGTSEGLFSS
ncbi:MAG: hypothetical protein ACKO2N_15795, partial [Tabrizicola sp.]